jgi:stress-induced morphogen
MFEIHVESPEFSGLSRVKQHQLVNGILAEEVKSMHGIRISTAIPQKSDKDG